MLETVFDEVRKDIGIELVVLAVVLVDEERWNFTGDDDFGFAFQVAQVVKENRPHIIGVLAGMEEKPAPGGALRDAGNGVEQRVALDL